MLGRQPKILAVWDTLRTPRREEIPFRKQAESREGTTDNTMAMAYGPYTVLGP